MTTHIVAIGGGALGAEGGALDRYALELVDARRPKVCLVPTATAAVPVAVVRFLEAFPARSFEPNYLDLFDRTVGDVTSFLGEQDLIYVGGGNTANLLAVWRLHGVDAALRKAWEAGVVCCGVSAGANCWFAASTTDSFLRGRADPLLDGLGLVEGSFCPHYDGEPSRRPSYLGLVGDGTLPDGYACEDLAAVHLVDGALGTAIAARDGATAYRVSRGAGGAEEEPLPMRFLGGTG